MANYALEVLEIETRYAGRQIKSLVKIAWIDLQILACNIRIALYS